MLIDERNEVSVQCENIYREDYDYFSSWVLLWCLNNHRVMVCLYIRDTMKSCIQNNLISA